MKMGASMSVPYIILLYPNRIALGAAPIDGIRASACKVRKSKFEQTNPFPRNCISRLLVQRIFTVYPCGIFRLLGTQIKSPGLAAGASSNRGK